MTHVHVLYPSHSLGLLILLFCFASVWCKGYACRWTFWYIHNIAELHSQYTAYVAPQLVHKKMGPRRFLYLNKSRLKYLLYMLYWLINGQYLLAIELLIIMSSFETRSRTFEGIDWVFLTFMYMIPATAAFIRSRFHQLIGSTGVRSHTMVMMSE